MYTNRGFIMIIITGAAGFIGSYLTKKLNEAGYHDLVLADDFSRPDKRPNFEGKVYRERVHRDFLPIWLRARHADIDAVFHIGARTDTTEQDVAVFNRLNLHYAEALWQLCTEFQIPLFYASSAATYGLGELGYSDDHALIPQLKPLNPYGQSKQDFDVWVLEQIRQGKTPPHWAGFKFFNVYGPNEYHKGRMASVIFHTARQIKATGGMKLFRSHRPDYKDGEQRRDFVYVKDVAEVLIHFLEKKPASAIYNLGTGKARTFLDLAVGTFHALGLEPNISFVDTPADIRDTYQYFTEADIRKMRELGAYQADFHSLEEGIADYVGNYLQTEQIY